MRDISARRQAGDTPGAIALVDRLFAGPPEATPPPDTVEAELFDTVAHDPALSPALFRHLVDRFGWRDPAHPARRADAERHAAFLRRLAAEDWFQSLEQAAALPGHPAAALALSHANSAVPSLDAAGKRQAREIIANLLRWPDLLLDRLDARSLATLREAVEGPPRVVAMPQAPAFPTSRIAAFRERIGWSGQIAIAAFLACIVLAVWETPGLWRSPQSPQEQARSILVSTEDRWLEFRRTTDGTIVYFTQLLSWRKGLRAIRYGLDTQTPDQTFPLPPAPPGGPDADKAGNSMTGVPIMVRASAKLGFVSAQVTYFDGTTSPVRVFRVEGGR